MGFWDKVKAAVLGTRKERTPSLPTRPRELPRLDLMEYKSFDLGQRFEQIFTAIKLHDERMIKFITDHDQAMLDRLDIIIKMLKEPIFAVADIRINKEEVLKEFEKTAILTMKELKDRLKASTETLNYHLKNLEQDGLILHTGYGQYKAAEPSTEETPIINKINIETPKETDTQVKEGSE